MMDTEKLLQKNIQLWSRTCPKQAFMLPYVSMDGLKECKTQQNEPNLKKTHESQSFYLHSQAGAEVEAQKWFEKLSLEKIPLVFVYGVGLGYYYDAIKGWLKEDKKRRVVFLEDDLAVIRKLLETERGQAILQDMQVQLVSFSNVREDEIFETLYWNFAMTRLVVTSLHSYLDHHAAVLSELRHKIAYDAAMKNALVDEYVKYGARYYFNFYQNMLKLPGSYRGNAFFGKFPKVPAIICGAGPSLGKNLSKLAGLLDHAVVFAGGSALNVLNSAGFQPHFGAGIDPNPMQLERLRANSAHEVPFFYRNRMYPQAFEKISGPRLYIAGSGGYDTAELFEKRLKINADWLDEGHNVVNFCVEIAHAMGCDPILFVGMDLAFTGMHEYAPGVVDQTKISQSTILDVEHEDDRALIKNDIFGKPTYTLWKWLAESEWIGEYAKDHPHITMLNCTEGGLGFPGISNVSLKEAAQKYLRHSYELRARIHGETQNSAMPSVTLRKIINTMRLLEKSLQNCVEQLKTLAEDSEEMLKKMKAKQPAVQSGKAALAEMELSEEPAFKHVLEVFNEIYTRILSRDVHEINLLPISEERRKQKILGLAARKCTFLRDAALVNLELLALALREHKKSIEEDRLFPELPKVKPGKYQFKNERLQLVDGELGLDIDEEFTPLCIPKVKKDGVEVAPGYFLKIILDDSWRIAQCAIEHKGQWCGQCLVFYPSGAIKHETFYAAGQLHGPVTFFSESGEVLAKSWFIKGKQVGKSHWYYPDGTLYSLQRFVKGVWHGLQEFYQQNGQLKTLLEYAEGKLIKAY